MGKKIVITLLLYIFIHTVRSVRILAVFPTASISHQAVFRPFTKKLAMLGHEVTIITPDPAYKKEDIPNNIKEIDVHNISYNIRKEAIVAASKIKESTIYNEGKIILKYLTKIVDAQLSCKEVQDIIHKVNCDFDLIILEAYVKLTLGFSHIFKVPIIQISSFGTFSLHNYAYGIPSHPFIYPRVFHHRIYNVTTYEKIQDLYANEWRLENLRKAQEEKDNKVLQKRFGSDIPHVTDLIRNMDMLFLNVHPILLDNQPLPLNVVAIGGIHVKPAEPLPKDLKQFLDSSKHGVIYFSLGTNSLSSLLPPNVIKTFVKSFSNLPYDVLWKWEEDVLPGQSANIKISKWLPQSDLLAHPNIKLFITQGGLQSTDEAINAAVPLIGLPMSTDQWYNAEKYVHHKIGIKLDINLVTEEKLTEAIKTVISNKSYRENIIRLRDLIQDQKESPLERAIWWTEYTIRHNGAKHMRAGAANIPWWEYYELEIIFILLTVIFIIFLLFVLFVRYLKNFISSSCFS